MAEEISVILTADASKLAAELQKAENELRQFQAALKRTGDVAEIEKLQQSIAKTTQQINLLNKAQGQLSGSSNKAAYALGDLSRIAQDAPYGFIGIQNNLNPLLESFQRLQAESKATGVSITSLISSALKGPAGIGLALGIVTAALTFAEIGFSRWGASAKKAKEAADEVKKAFDNIVNSIASEATQVTSLVAVLDNETESRNRKLSALKELKQINPEIFGDLDLEKGKVNGLTEAYNVYIASLKNTLSAKLIQGRLEKELTKLIELEGGAETERERNGKKFAKTLGTTITNSYRQFGAEGANAALALEEINAAVDKKAQDKITAVKNKITDLTAELSKLSKSIKLPELLPDKKAKTKVEKAKKALETFDDVIKQTVKTISDQKDLAIILDESTVKDQIKTIRDAIERGVKDFNQPTNDQRILTLKAMLEDLEAQLAVEEATKKLDKEAKKNGPKVKIGAKIVPKIETTDVDIAKALNEALSSSISKIGVGLGEGIAAAIQGTVNFGDIFKGIFGELGGVIKQLGQQLIELGALAIVAQLALEQIFVNPYAAVAAGIALVALGSLIQSTTAKKNRFAVGTRNAPGGMALVGERGPEMINLPRGSQVIPAAQTSNMLGGIGKSLEIYGILRGQDIYFSNKKYSATYARTT
jgi:hypothetical protein